MHRVLIIGTANLGWITLVDIIDGPPQIQAGAKFLTLDVTTQGVFVPFYA